MDCGFSEKPRDKKIWNEYRIAQETGWSLGDIRRLSIYERTKIVGLINKEVRRAKQELRKNKR